MVNNWTVGEFTQILMIGSLNYSEQLEVYMQANKFNDPEKKQAHFLNSCNAPVYNLIRSLTSSATPQQTSYKDIVQLVMDHFKQKTSTAIACLKFHSRNRQPDKSVSTFIAELSEFF